MSNAVLMYFENNYSAGILTSKNCVVRTTKTKPLPKVESKPTIKGKSSFFIKTARVENTDSKHDTTEPLKEEAKEKCSIITKTVSSGAEDRNTKENKKNDIKQILKVIRVLCLKCNVNYWFLA